jgi:hypothetical protein
MTEDRDLLGKFAPRIVNLPDGELKKEDVLIPEFLLVKEGNVEIYYAPFHHTNELARLALVGITPRWTQTEVRARKPVWCYLLQDNPPAEACRLADQEASFAGQMRRNLITMLNELGVPSYLGIPPAELFAPENYGLLHTTSAIRYPVFIRRGDEWQNFTGYSPPLVESPLLRSDLQSKLADELTRVRHALIVPLGNSVSAALRLLIQKDILNARQCLIGFPHPAGGNGHRVRQFIEAKDRLTRQVADWFESKDDRTSTVSLSL